MTDVLALLMDVEEAMRDYCWDDKNHLVGDGSRYRIYQDVCKAIGNLRHNRNLYKGWIDLRGDQITEVWERTIGCHDDYQDFGFALESVIQVNNGVRRPDGSLYTLALSLTLDD